MKKNYRAYRYFVSVCLCLPGFLSFSQKQSGFTWPIDSPRVITGNYGELRPNHFHGGLDFSTNGQVNLQVYAAAEGYVSRIRVSSVGYGKSVYITHPNGKVSVYAHLNSFSLKLATSVKKEQYEKKNFEIELFPKPNTIPVRKGEIIGLSGNTGGSTGPHVHFEIRDERTETPLNPLGFFKIKDTEKPVIQKVSFYDLSDTCAPRFLRAFKVKTLARGAVPEKDSIVLDQSIVGFAFSGSDRCTANGNQNNIFSAKVYVDGRLIYSHTLDRIDFSDNRYVNEFSEVVDRAKFQKCFLPEVYPTNMYGDCFNKGRILLSDSNYHYLKAVFTDESGNEQILQLHVKTKHYNYYRPQAAKSELFVNCSRDFKIRKNGLSIHIPAKTLFSSAALSVDNALETGGGLTLLPANLNFRNAAVIGFKVAAKDRRRAAKLILKSGPAVYTPTCRNDSVFFSIKNSGIFRLGYDTIGPKLRTQLNAKQMRKAKASRSFSFVVDDHGSGIMSYSLFLNGSWVIGEYDAKHDLVTYYFDEDTPAGSLAFRLEATDKTGNRSVLVYTLKR